MLLFYIYENGIIEFSAYYKEAIFQSRNKYEDELVSELEDIES